MTIGTLRVDSITRNSSSTTVIWCLPSPNLSRTALCSLLRPLQTSSREVYHVPQMKSILAITLRNGPLKLTIKRRRANLRIKNRFSNTISINSQSSKYRTAIRVIQIWHTTCKIIKSHYRSDHSLTVSWCSNNNPVQLDLNNSTTGLRAPISKKSHKGTSAPIKIKLWSNRMNKSLHNTQEASMTLMLSKVSISHRVQLMHMTSPVQINNNKQSIRCMRSESPSVASRRAKTK